MKLRIKARQGMPWIALVCSVIALGLALTA